MPVTDFGKILRKIRIDRDEVLQDMATKLNVTASYLFAIEKGKRNVPLEWLNTLPATYALSDQLACELRQVAVTQMPFIKLKLTNTTMKGKELVFTLAQQIDKLDDVTLEKLNAVLVSKK